MWRADEQLPGFTSVLHRRSSIPPINTVGPEVVSGSSINAAWRIPVLRRVRGNRHAQVI